jgi:hypothetical protein
MFGVFLSSLCQRVETELDQIGDAQQSPGTCYDTDSPHASRVSPFLFFIPSLPSPSPVR